MKKFIMLLAALSMGGSIVFGLLNKETLSNVLTELKNTNQEVSTVTQELGETEDKVEGAVERETQAKDERNMASAAVQGVNQQLALVEKSVSDVQSDLKKIEIEHKEIELAIQKQFPDGNIKSPEELTAMVTMLRQTVTDHQNAKASLEADLSAAMQERKTAAAKVQEEENYQRQRAQKLSLNGLVATIIAVNNEWGFVMVNAGRIHGVDAESSLLVRRGNSRIARLRIVNLQDNMLVADVVKESLMKGLKVQPGDKVIFENVR